MLLLGGFSTAQAKIDTQYAAMTRHSDGVYALNADFRLSLPNQLKDAINHGTPCLFKSNSNSPVHVGIGPMKT